MKRGGEVIENPCENRIGGKKYFEFVGGGKKLYWVLKSTPKGFCEAFQKV